MNAKEALKIEIARRKRLERQLRQCHATLKQVEGLANIGHFERDLVMDCITWSEETARIFGRRPAEQKLNQAMLERQIHPDDRKRQRQALEAVLHSHRRYNVEYRIVLPDGEIRFVRVRDEVTRDKSGRPIRVFGTVQDITARKKTEELRERYRHLTPREREVMDLVVRGKMNKEIAEHLGTADITVKVQRRNVMKKMKAGSLAELVYFAFALQMAETDYTLV